jgi:uncharacterized protein with PIN domain
MLEDYKEYKMKMKCKKMRIYGKKNVLKKEKAKAKHDMAKIEQDKIDIMKEEFLLKKQQDKKRIMLIDTKSMPQYLAEYYKIRQIEILTKRCISSFN